MSTNSAYNKPGNKGLIRIVKAIGYSFKGLKSAFFYESAFRQEIAITLLLTPVLLLSETSFVEKVILAGTLVNLLVVELINSAIEATVDRIGSDFNELSGRAKDIGSAAVFLSLCFASITWIGILL
ncbi:diacylglycerol kinase [Vibrio spartinae]|uniref:Diacylglycerol kinase n=1 Tax=Vibrio spartinae TaxID=1918945 RepID=A0A1N6LZT9_9VIBR|nr:diacylglycerol kinase [Vibrio spartinae]QMV16337.1 Diacylglycerol kinase [Vibrio spartinae]SIO92672.1 Diacylglycerol kinase [Vibrio spartinae]